MNHSQQVARMLVSLADGLVDHPDDERLQVLSHQLRELLYAIGSRPSDSIEAVDSMQIGEVHFEHAVNRGGVYRSTSHNLSSLALNLRRVPNLPSLLCQYADEEFSDLNEHDWENVIRLLCIVASILPEANDLIADEE